MRVREKEEVAIGKPCLWEGLEGATYNSSTQRQCFGHTFRVSWSLLLLYRINSQLLLPMMLLLLSNHELK